MNKEMKWKASEEWAPDDCESVLALLAATTLYLYPN
jgi:hypothetical protein